MRPDPGCSTAQVAALGFVSVFDQIMEGLPGEEQKAVLDAFAGALQEDSAKYRRDAEELEAVAKETSGETSTLNPCLISDPLPSTGLDLHSFLCFL